MSLCSRTRSTLALTLGAAVALVALVPPARADVTVAQKTSMDLGAIKIDIDSVEHTSADKQRNDSTVTCHGFLSLFCHDVESGRIVRLDRQLEWQLQPRRRSATPSGLSRHPRSAPRRSRPLEAAIEQMKNCPMPQSAERAANRGARHVAAVN